MKKLLARIRGLISGRPPAEPAAGSEDNPSVPSLVAAAARAVSSVVSRAASLVPGRDANLASLIIARQLPRGFQAGSHVNLNGTGVREIPADFMVKGNLRLQQCPRLRKIGTGLNVSGELHLGGRPDSVSNKDRHCYLRELPPLRARFLYISNAPYLKSLPRGMKVECLTLSDCAALEELPEDLVVRRLRITGCPRLRSLPASMKVEHLTLINAAIVDLPDFFGATTVEIAGCRRLRSLPKTWKGVSMRLAHLPGIANLPDMSASWRISIKGLPLLTRIASPLSSREIRVTNCQNLVSFVPERLEAVEILDLSSCRRLVELPPALTAEALQLQNCSALGRLPSPLKLGNSRHAALTCLDLTRCSGLRELPSEFTFLGAVVLTGSGLETNEPASLNFRIRMRGVALPASAYYQPGKLNPGGVLLEQNTELRRVLIERIGLEKVLESARAKVIDADTDPGGPRQLLRVLPPKLHEDFLQFLRCQCPSTGRVYLLRVPPVVRTCREAAAWMAGFSDPDDYQPILET